MIIDVYILEEKDCPACEETRILKVAGDMDIIKNFIANREQPAIRPEEVIIKPYGNDEDGYSDDNFYVEYPENENWYNLSFHKMELPPVPVFTPKG